MPMTWIEPEELMTHNGVVIYHTYKNDSADDRQSYWYTTDISDDEDFEFDVRDLPVPEGVGAENHRFIIAHAIDRDLIVLADIDEIEVPTVQVSAEIWSDDERRAVEFDAAQWLRQAPSSEIIALHDCGWRGDYAADVVGEWMESYDYRVAGLFHYIRNTELPEDLSAFDVAVDEASALKYLEDNLPEEYGDLMVHKGLAVRVSGVVDETITIQKHVSGYISVEEPQFQSILFDSETGAKTASGLVDLQIDAEFDEKLASYLREIAYSELITSDGDHGWEVTDSEGVVIDKVELHEA